MITILSLLPIILYLFFFSGYLYAHISYLEDGCPACLLLLSTDRNAFFELAETRLKTLEVSAFIKLMMVVTLWMKYWTAPIYSVIQVFKLLYQVLLSFGESNIPKKMATVSVQKPKTTHNNVQ